MKRQQLFVVLIVCFLLTAGCGMVTISPTSSSTNSNSVISTIPLATIPQNTQVFTPSPNILTPELPKERFLLTIDDVKNIPDSYKISLDGDNLVGLPEDVSEEEIELVKSYYQAMQERFSHLDTYYNKDAVSGNIAIYSFKDEVLVLQTMKLADGSNIYSDFPSVFEEFGGGYKLVGDYHIEILPARSVGLMWNNNLPQFLMDKVVLNNGDTYYKKYFSYTTVVGNNPWVDIPGFEQVASMIPTPTSSNLEKILEPIFTLNVSGDYMGVRIDAELLVDNSASYKISKVSISDKDYLEYVARMFFKVWWANGKIKHSGFPTEEDFVSFMNLWKKAQETGDFQDWEEVQISNIWGNDLNDGEVYHQKPYTLWPMYFFENTPADIKGISKFSSVRVSGVGVIEQYVTKYYMGTFFIGKGTHFQDNTMYIYDYCADYGLLKSVRVDILASLSANSWWLGLNKGYDTMATYLMDKIQYSLLERSLYVESE